LLHNLEQTHNRRKAVIMISGGYDFNPFASSRAGTAGAGFLNNQNVDPNDPSNSMFTQGQQFSDTDLAIELNELIRSANRANATFYTVDPRGLMAGQDLDEQVDPVEWETHLRKQQDSLRVLAEQTGGIAVVNTNDFSKALKRIDAETSDYYVLGYYSSNPDPTQRRRQVEIRVKKREFRSAVQAGVHAEAGADGCQAEGLAVDSSTTPIALRSGARCHSGARQPCDCADARASDIRRPSPRHNSHRDWWRARGNVPRHSRTQAW
jgi:VWFA-related protein